MSMSNEHLEQIDKRIWDALWGLEVRGDTGWAEVVVRSDAPELLAEVKRLKEAPTITDEMVERAGKALSARGWALMNAHKPPCWCEDCKRVCTEDARRVLEAALGDQTQEMNQ